MPSTNSPMLEQSSVYNAITDIEKGGGGERGINQK